MVVGSCREFTIHSSLNLSLLYAGIYKAPEDILNILLDPRTLLQIFSFQVSDYQLSNVQNYHLIFLSDISYFHSSLPWIYITRNLKNNVLIMYY